MPCHVPVPVFRYAPVLWLLQERLAYATTLCFCGKRTVVVLCRCYFQHASEIRNPVCKRSGSRGLLNWTGNLFLRSVSHMCVGHVCCEGAFSVFLQQFAGMDSRGLKKYVYRLNIFLYHYTMSPRHFLDTCTLLVAIWFVCSPRHDFGNFSSYWSPNEPA